MKPRAGHIDRFCSKLSQINLKRLVKIPCEHTCHTKDGPRSGHERSPKSKILFRACSTWFTVTFARRIQKSKPFLIWPHASHRQKRVRSTRVMWGQIFEQLFSNKNARLSTNLISGFQKCHFYFCAMSRNAPNRSSKNGVINGYGFWARYLPKIDVSTWNLAH